MCLWVLPRSEQKQTGYMPRIQHPRRTGHHKRDGYNVPNDQIPAENLRIFTFTLIHNTQHGITTFPSQQQVLQRHLNDRVGLSVGQSRRKCDGRRVVREVPAGGLVSGLGSRTTRKTGYGGHQQRHAPSRWRKHDSCYEMETFSKFHSLGDVDIQMREELGLQNAPLICGNLCSFEYFCSFVRCFASLVIQ